MRWMNAGSLTGDSGPEGRQYGVLFAGERIASPALLGADGTILLETIRSQYGSSFPLVQ